MHTPLCWAIPMLDHRISDPRTEDFFLSVFWSALQHLSFLKGWVKECRRSDWKTLVHTRLLSCSSNLWMGILCWASCATAACIGGLQDHLYPRGICGTQSVLNPANLQGHSGSEQSGGGTQEALSFELKGILRLNHLEFFCICFTSFTIWFYAHSYWVQNVTYTLRLELPILTYQSCALEKNWDSREIFHF